VRRECLVFEESVIVLELFYFSEKNEMFWFTNEVELALSLQPPNIAQDQKCLAVSNGSKNR
jgi:hypothetical protein